MRLFVAVLFVPGLSGCLVDVLMSTAIQGELQAEQATAAQNTLNRVTNDTGQMNLQRAVDTFHGESGNYPQSLNELVPGFINPIPQRADGGNFGYNPISGQVLETDSGPSASDYLLMEDIALAINAYGTASGLYPPTLDALAETGYLPQSPRTENGLEFTYNNQNGAFSHPLDGHVAGAPQPTQRRSGAVAAGGGPVGEALTGIAIQEQLNSNSNAGSSRSRSQGATGINRATSTQNARQQKALEELGF
jgi:hypothetical protein